MEERERRSRTTSDRRRSKAGRGRQELAQQEAEPRQARLTGYDKAARTPEGTGCGKAEGSQKTAGDRKAAGGQKAAGEKIAVREWDSKPPARAAIKRRRKRNLGIKIFLVIILAILSLRWQHFYGKRYSPSKESMI